MICPLCLAHIPAPHAPAECVPGLLQLISAQCSMIERASALMIAMEKRTAALEAALRPLAAIESNRTLERPDAHELLVWKALRLYADPRGFVGDYEERMALTLGDVRLARKLLEEGNAQKTDDDTIVGRIGEGK